MAFPAKRSGTCVRCGKPINVGDSIVIYNRPKPGSTFHADCPDEGKVEHKAPEGEGRGEQGEPKGPGQGKGGAEGKGEPKEGKGNEQGEQGEGKQDSPPPSPIEQIIRDIAKDEIGKAKIEVGAPQRIEIKVPEMPPFDASGAHYYLPRVIRVLMAGLYPYLWGEAGTGKTTALIQAASAIGVPFELDTLDRSTPRSALTGYRTPNGEAVQTGLTRAYVARALLIHDEMDNSPGYVQNILNTCLANGHLAAAWGVLPKDVGFMYSAAGNTPFRPTPRYPDRQPGSAAFMDRLYFMHWPLDPNIERRATGRPLVAPPVREEWTCSPAKWGQWVEEVREYILDNVPSMQVTPRATLAGLRALAAGETPLEVAHGLVFRGADEALTGKILAAVPLPRD